jgi:fucose 4-O-acetylase-like acetyltransferase
MNNFQNLFKVLKKDLTKLSEFVQLGKRSLNIYSLRTVFFAITTIPDSVTVNFSLSLSGSNPIS